MLEKVGDCRRCGRCCRIVLFPLPKGDRVDITKWLDAHQHMHVVGNYVVIDSKCKHLGFKGGQHYCKIWDTRPTVCKEGTCLRK